MKKLTIFIVLPSFASGGAERVTISLIENMDKNYFNYFLVMQNTNGPLKCNISNKKIINLNAFKFRYALINLVKVIYKKKPKVIFSTFPHITIFLLIIKKIFFPKMTIISREPNMPSISLLHTSNSYIIRKLYNIFMPSIDGVIASSTAMKNELILKGIIAKKIAIISNPINTKKIRNIEKVHRFGGKGLRLVFVGRLVYQKGLDRLIPILKNIKNIHLTIIGEGLERSNLEKLIKKYKINDKIYHRYNDNIYLNLLANLQDNNLDNILLKKKLIGNIDKEGHIYINDYSVNLISINKKKYYLVNNKDLYNIDNFDILNINLDFKKGKLLGPKICIIDKQMIIIENNKLKYNVWEIII